MNPHNPSNLTPEVLESIMSDRKVRRNLARQTHPMFFSIYLPHYSRFATAPCQHEFFRITEDQTSMLDVVVAFRGSGKSTIMTQSYAIWSVIGKLEKKFVLILSQTQAQARQHLINIKREMESNAVLKLELGPFEEPEDEWGSQTLVIPKHGARIMAASAEQSIRGFRHGQHRPDLIICDDVEDMASVKTREGRDKTYNWLTGEILPAGDITTKVLVIGNLLHEDSLLMRLKRNIGVGTMTGRFHSFPLITPEGRSGWPGQFPSLDAIEAYRKRIGNEIAWQREYLLQIVPDEDQLIRHDWIQRYDRRPGHQHENYRYAAIGIDLAISKRDTADYTAMVSAEVYGYGDDFKVYILPHPVNERLSHLEALTKAMELSNKHGHDGAKAKLYVEDVGYQSALVEQLENRFFPAEGVKIQGQDKRARLAAVSYLIESGKVVFPKQGADVLIGQLTGFGTENYDDLADATAILLRRVMQDDRAQSDVRVSVGGSSMFADFWRFENGRGRHDWEDNDDDWPLTGGLMDKQF